MIFVLCFIFIGLTGGICLFISHKRNRYDEPGFEFAGTVLIVISIVCLTIGGIKMMVKEIEADAYIAKFEAVKITFKLAREHVNLFEIASIQRKVAEKNEQLANDQYWAECPLTNWFWSRRILEIKPIK